MIRLLFLLLMLGSLAARADEDALQRAFAEGMQAQQAGELSRAESIFRRMLAALDEVMPAEMALLNIQFENVERQKAVTSLGSVKGNGSKPAVQLDRRLEVRLVGVTPTDVDLANFLARLSKVRYFDGVTMTYSKDRNEAGHVMREFEVRFSLNLNGDGSQ